MKINETLLARLKQLRSRQDEEARVRRQLAEECGIKYSAEYRSENLRLLRAIFNERQEDFVSMLGIGGQSLYSQFERGERDLEGNDARRIEKNLCLPENWFDRDNSNSLLIGQNELALVLELRSLSSEAALKLTQTIKLLRRS